MKTRPTILIALAALLWGSVGIFSRKLSILGIETMHIVFLRAFGASFILAAFMLIRNKTLPKIAISDIKYYVGTGIASFAFFNWCFFNSVNESGIPTAAILLYTAPAMISVMSYFLFKEKFTLIKTIALMATFAGIILVSIGSGLGNINLKGIVFGLLAGFGYALYSIFGRFALTKNDSASVTFYTFIFATIGMLPAILVRPMNIHGEIGLVVALSSGLALIGTVVPFLFYTSGLKTLMPARASIIATLEPAAASMYAMIIFSEKIDLVKSAGILIIIASVIILSATAKNNEEQNA